jgi:hypothetical protein
VSDQDFMRRLDETRYLVSWVPLSDVEKLCRQRGMKDGDSTSFWDWCEPEACQQTIEKRSFAEAVFAAKAVLKYDVCGEVRIERQALVRDHDDIGNVFKSKSWEEDAVWHLHDPADVLTEDEPDYRAAA